MKDAKEAIQYHKNLIEKVRHDTALDYVGTAKNIEEEKYHPPDEVTSRQVIEKNVKIYQEAFQKLRELKSQIEQTKLQVERGRISLQKDFDIWYERMCIFVNEDQHSSIEFQKVNEAIFHVNNERDIVQQQSRQNDRDNHNNSFLRSNGAEFELPPGARLTGVKDTDDDIIAFYKAKEALIARNKARNN